MNALASLVVVGSAGLIAFLAYASRKISSSSAEPVGGLWGMLNEGADSNPFLPSPAPVPSSYRPDANAPRGIRNRNPGNVKRSGSAWLGKIPFSQSTDSTFEQFSEPLYGLRVIAYLLLKFQRDKGKKTIRQLIGESGGWAPTESDKNPSSYATWVAAQLGVSETAAIDLYAGRNLERMVAAIVQFENGQQPYTSALIADAVASAIKGAA